MAVWTIRALAIWGALFAILLVIGTWSQPEDRAIASMAASLMLIWVVLCGGAMYLRREPLTARFRSLPGPRPLVFALSATLLALVEEGITVSLSNAAPLFGVPRGEVMITASLNYVDVVLRHSVIVFVPMFVAWGWLLSRYSFSPTHVFLLFGITGTLAESLSFGPQMLLGIGQWTFVYGLMVWLPARAIAGQYTLRRPPAVLMPVAVIAPLLAAMPVVILVMVLA